ncbi:hypothetical protein [Myxococcus sp. CA040A]|uniref:hypothetical protein n=1 Tax=Myxococcus sp. CA040A TaxID=2741738 RepID=UPI00157B8192|nr:hypothetical protein [Myxococcus sp. CA040A]NTX00530.1 hypothetical protein [Myxococcus sp. CA040A]
MRQRTKVLLVSAVAVACGVLGWGLVRPTGAVVPPTTPASPSTSGAATRQAPVTARPSAVTAPPVMPSPAPVPGAVDAELEALATSLREKYGAKLHEPYLQIRMVEELMRFFQERFPDRWEQELLAFLKANFPEHYDTLAAMLRNRVDYEKWVRDSESYLRGLGDTERRAATWDARHRLFGKENAERIWASERKNQAIADTLRTLGAQEGVSLEKKLSTYKERLQEVHGEQAAAYVERHQQELMNRFLDLPSVQTDLGAMPADERARSLRSVRKEMGLDDEALQRWDTLDQSRDARWDAGAKYMAEREALAKELSGEALEAKLVELRARYFGGEAETIGQEEAGGFLRFTRPRQWGRN